MPLLSLLFGFSNTRNASKLVFRNPDVCVGCFVVVASFLRIL